MQRCMLCGELGGPTLHEMSAYVSVRGGKSRPAKPTEHTGRDLRWVGMLGPVHYDCDEQNWWEVKDYPEEDS